jgi:hypothetical protein
MKMGWNEETFTITELDPLTAELLRRIPGCASAEDGAAKSRLFPAPTGGAEEEADAEWRETVEPELRELFATNVETVEADLKTMTETEEGLQLTVPIKNAPAWIHTINQARLALGARHSITEENMNGHALPEDPQDAFAVFQVEFYGAVLSFLVYHAEW